MKFQSLVLASASPRRKELLLTAGFEFITDPADVDESAHPDENPEDYASRIALAKAVTTASRHSSGIVLGADTIVVVDGEIFGKPSGEADARRMLLRLSGREHRVLTAVAIVDAETGRSATAVEETKVLVSPLSARTIDEYIKTGEPMDKAGAYGIQGGASVFIEGISGCFFNVVGLPLYRVSVMLEGFGKG